MSQSASRIQSGRSGKRGHDCPHCGRPLTWWNRWKARYGAEFACIRCSYCWWAAWAYTERPR